MSSWLLIIFVIGSSVTFGGFPSKFSKCCFHRCIHSSWLVAFSLTLAVLFLLFTLFTVCYANLDCLSSTESLILLIFFWDVFYLFFLVYVSLFCALNFWALILIGFFLLHSDAVFMSARFFLTANVSHGTLDLALCLVCMHSAAISMWVLSKFSYSSFGVGVSDISWSALNLFFCINV